MAGGGGQQHSSTNENDNKTHLLLSILEANRRQNHGYSCTMIMLGLGPGRGRGRTRLCSAGQMRGTIERSLLQASGQPPANLNDDLTTTMANLFSRPERLSALQSLARDIEGRIDTKLCLSSLLPTPSNNKVQVHAKAPAYGRVLLSVAPDWRVLGKVAAVMVAQEAPQAPLAELKPSKLYLSASLCVYERECSGLPGPEPEPLLPVPLCPG